MIKKPLVVDIFIPCFVDQVYPETGFNMTKVLEKLGCTVNYNPNQTCCGQPAFNAGYFDEAKEVAVKFINDFSNPNRFIVAPSASCVGMVKNSYNQLFNGSAHYLDYKKLHKNIFELSDFLVNVMKVDKIPDSKLSAKVTYHDSCSGLRECGIKEEPRKLLRNVQGLEMIEMKDNEVCCGFGGTFAVKFEPISIGMAEQKVENALATGAEIIVSTDSSCLMQLEGYIKNKNLPIKTMHIADVLASGW